VNEPDEETEPLRQTPGVLRPTRLALASWLSVPLAFHVHVHIHHHFHGPPGGYIGLAAAALASWAGLPGPGEAALVAGGVVAARGRLDVVEVVLIAWAGAAAGGMIGWVLGLRGGRALVATRRLPLYRSRTRALGQGERFFERYGLLAVFFTPSWMAGIAEMRWTRFIPANAVASLVWALTLGAGSYFAGPPIVDVFQDVGTAGLIVVLGALFGGILLESVRRRRRRARLGS
jgi:membrane protein DedA with SNARE-associated domain